MLSYPIISYLTKDGATIFDGFFRILIRNLGGICYERAEVLYQVLVFLGYNAYRFETRSISKDHMVNNSPRYDHMVVGVELDKSWFVCEMGGRIQESGQVLPLFKSSKFHRPLI